MAKAKELSPQTLRRVARRAVEAIEPDPAVVDAHEDAIVYDEEAAARERTRLTFHDNHDGTVTGHFTVPVLQGHLLRKVIETMTAPRRGRLGASVAQAGPTRVRGPTGTTRAASPSVSCVEHLPTDHLHPRSAATLVVTVRDDVLRGSLAAAGLDTGESISSGEARRLACGAGLVPAVLGGRSVPLDLGRSRRLFSDHQRVGVGLTHPTCAADGCERPFAWCELHHRQTLGEPRAVGPGERGAPVPLPPSAHPRHRVSCTPGFPTAASASVGGREEQPGVGELRRGSPRPSPPGRAGTPSAGTARRTCRRARRPGRGTPGARCARPRPRSRS